MDNTKNERNLHLVGIQETNLVGGCLPDGINTEGVGGVTVLVRVLGVQHDGGLEADWGVVADLEGVIGGPVGSEYVEGFGEYVIINQS